MSQDGKRGSFDDTFSRFTNLAALAWFAGLLGCLLAGPPGKADVAGVACLLAGWLGLAGIGWGWLGLAGRVADMLGWLEQGSRMVGWPAGRVAGRAVEVAGAAGWMRLARLDGPVAGGSVGCSQ